MCLIYLPVERPIKTPISIDLNNLQPIPLSPTSPRGVTEPFDVKTPAMLRLVQRQLSDTPQGNRYPILNCFVNMNYLCVSVGLS